MKKKLAAGLASACLIAALGVGATLAYFTSTTDAKTNTFTVGNVKIDLLEPEWKPEEGRTLMPGAEVEKNPYITNIGSGAGYVMLRVDGMAEMARKGFRVRTGDADGYQYEKWVLVDDQGTPLEAPANHALVDGYYIYQGGEVAPGSQTEPLFTSVVFDEDAAEVEATVYRVSAKYRDENGYFTYRDESGNVIAENQNRTPQTDADGNVVIRYFVEGDADHNPAQGYESYAKAEDHVLAQHQDTADFVFNLTVQGYAIQSENVTFTENGSYPWVKELAR